MATPNETPNDKDGREKSAFVVFWSSLPGILTGVAAVIGAVAGLAALFLGNSDSGSRAPVASSTSAAQAAPSVSAPARSNNGPNAAGGGCFPRYFNGIPQDRIAQLEAGTANFDVIAASQPKAGTVGLRFTNNNRSIGAIRFDFLPTNLIFKVESVVDARCKLIEDYSNITRGGDKNLLQNYDSLRLRLDGAAYDMNVDGAATIRLNFMSVAP